MPLRLCLSLSIVSLGHACPSTALHADKRLARAGARLGVRCRAKRVERAAVGSTPFMMLLFSACISLIGGWNDYILVTDTRRVPHAWSLLIALLIVVLGAGAAV